jgi:ABC-type Co2+ transport system permease subunit
VNKLLAAVHLDDPASLKRFIVLVLSTIGLGIINPVLESKGLPVLTDTHILAIAGVILTWLAQSGANSVAQKKADSVTAGASAAAAVTTVAQADAALALPPKVTP